MYKTIRQYDSIVLKDGTRGTVVEVYGKNEAFDVDIGSSPKDWKNITVCPDDIAEVIPQPD